MGRFENREEYLRYANEVREFTLAELEPMARQIDKARRLPATEVANKLKEKGLWNLTMPKKYGGQEFSFCEYWPLLATVSMTGRSIGILVHLQNTGGWRRVAYHGTEEQKEKYVRACAEGKFVRGRILAVGFAITEREAGTGKDIKTTATKRGNTWVLNGEKILITAPNLVGTYIVVARSSSDRDEFSTFLVPIDTPGFSWTSMGESMGLKGHLHGKLKFEDCVIPEENMLGRPGAGLDAGIHQLVLGRVGIAAACLGICRRCLELSVDFSKKRVTFGKTIAERQAVQGMLADMALAAYALERMVEDAAQKFDADMPITREASSCKLFGVEAVQKVTDNALLIHGGRGYFDEFPIERLYRDARAMWFEEGTPTIQRFVIARDVLQKPRWWI
jgi:alkylation response protein AidB-like acyl-CoA dehydrogenase